MGRAPKASYLIDHFEPQVDAALAALEKKPTLHHIVSELRRQRDFWINGYDDAVGQLNHAWNWIEKLEARAKAGAAVEIAE